VRYNIKQTIMKILTCVIITTTLLTACNNASQQTSSTQAKPAETKSLIQGTWKLISGTTIEKTDTTVTDYTKDKSFTKVINNTHFAFMGHDLNKGKDSASAFFSSGGGVYELNDNNYTEHLEYCNDRQWEGNDFNFTIGIQNDTLTQQGLEKIDSIGVNRVNIEKYVRVK
jgi:Cu/Zn superoxide dismutase